MKVTWPVVGFYSPEEFLAQLDPEERSRITELEIKGHDRLANIEFGGGWTNLTKLHLNGCESLTNQIGRAHV